jgi:hypothetical protein
LAFFFLSEEIKAHSRDNLDSLAAFWRLGLLAFRKLLLGLFLFDYITITAGNMRLVLIFLDMNFLKFDDSLNILPFYER